MNAPTPPSSPRQALRTEPNGRRAAAVIEVGSTSVRMVIAHISPKGEIRTDLPLQRPVTLGRETFTKGSIGREATEEAVRALRGFRQVLQEHGVPIESVRAVATSAVREAANRDAVLDRILMAAGIDVELADEAEVNRFTYFAVRPLFDREPALKRRQTLVVEVGGGNTQALLLQKGLVSHSHTYRLGSLRLRMMQENFGAPVSRIRDLMLPAVDRCIDQMFFDMPLAAATRLLLFGSEARFAAARLSPGSPHRLLAPVRTEALRALTEEIVDRSAEESVKRYRISYPEAETLGPALFFLSHLADRMKRTSIHVGFATLREGILHDVASRGLWSDDFRRQILNSVMQIGRRYAFDENHAQRVADTSQRLFRALREDHRLDDHHELILTVAALLHDIGTFISSRGHHRHSMYLIRHCDLFGLSARDLEMTSLVARYHRRALPSVLHPEYASIPREDRIVVSKLAALLRVADALDRSHAQPAGDFAIDRRAGQLVLGLDTPGDLDMEPYGLREKSDLFQQVFGMDVVLRGSGGSPDAAG